MSSDRPAEPTSPSPRKDIEKSIDSLQRIHAMVSALALGEAVRRLILNPGGADAAFNAEVMPQFIALVCTIVPFYHGMHRHLEHAYLFAQDTRHPKGVLLIDFVVFVVEACTFFALASLFHSPAFFWVLAALLTFDAVWGGLTALITPSNEIPVVLAELHYGRRHGGCAVAECVPAGHGSLAAGVDRRHPDDYRLLHALVFLFPLR